VKAFACTLETIAALAGHPVERGDRIDVPRWRVEQASLIERGQAMACLRRQHVRWRIVEDRR
jgi:hypothetical protein